MQTSGKENKDVNTCHDNLRDLQKSDSTQENMGSQNTDETEKKSESRRNNEPAKAGTSELLKAFSKMESRYSDMEKAMNKMFVDLESVFLSKIDRFENQVLREFIDVMNTMVSTLKEETW